MNRIALLEDHDRIADLVVRALASAGIEADVFGTISHAAAGFKQLPYAALIIDRGLPDGDGLTLLRELRRNGDKTPCLMLTAQNALHDRINGLEAGADDYLPKPFSMDELVARVRALLRRPAQTQTLNPSYLSLDICPDESSMTSAGDSVWLAPSELQIMLTLVRAAGKPVRRAALENAAWGLTTAVTPNALDVALHRLRRKLIAIGADLEITNVRAVGFALSEVPHAT
jgi:two-component system response regulator QseB